MRKLLSMLAAVPVALLLFLLMPSLIAVRAGPVDPPVTVDLPTAMPPVEEPPPPRGPREPPQPPVISEGIPVLPPEPPPTEDGRPDLPEGYSGVGIDTPIGPGAAMDLRDCDHGPIAIATPVKGYPVAAARAGTEGSVLVRFTVGATGAVTDAVVLSAEPSRVFDGHALDSVRRWRFRPAASACEAVAVRMEQRIAYALSD